MLGHLSTKNLLLLEDSDEFIENAVALFNIYVKNTYVAQTITQADILMKQYAIDFIISDIHLRNENGFDFIKQIRESNKDIPIVVISGDRGEPLLLQAIPLNLAGYLSKPINFKSLQSVFEECVMRFKSQNQTSVELKNGYVYHKNLKIITKDEASLSLNKKEILFFELLCHHKDKVITKEHIAYGVYEDEFMSDSALNNFIMRIRRRFGKSFLHTIPDVGYKLIV